MDFQDDPCYPLLGEAFDACHARLDTAIQSSTDPAQSPWLALAGYQGVMLAVLTISLFVIAVMATIHVRQNRRSNR